VAATIAKAADWLNGQIVVSVDIRATPAWTRFRFDLGGELVLRRYAEWAADDDLWHFYSGTTSIHFGADGAVRKSGRNEGLSNNEMQLTKRDGVWRRAHARTRVIQTTFRS
jgi:hypothetical protein